MMPSVLSVARELRHVAFAVVLVWSTTRSQAIAATAVPTPTPTPTQASVLDVSPSATRVTVTVFRIDRSLPVSAARILVVARDGGGRVVRTARAIDDASLLQTPEQPRFAFLFEPPLPPSSEPYEVEATALDLGFGGSARLIVAPVPADAGSAGDRFIATWWSSGATPGEPFEKRATPDGNFAYVSRNGKQHFAESAGGFYPEIVDDEVDRLREIFYGHDAIGPGVFVQCQNRKGQVMQAKLLTGRRIRIQEIGRAAHASERIADDPTRPFGGGESHFVDSPIVAEFGLAPGDTVAKISIISPVQTNFDPTCVRGFVLFQSAAQMLSVFSRV
jgi:hypothetical protein